jgi:hypothetical protein
MKLQKLILIPAFSLILSGCPNPSQMEVTPNVIPIVTQEVKEEVKEEQEQIVERNDFDINLTLGNYKVGDYLNFSGVIKNKTDKSITINNLEKNSLEYKLLKGSDVLFSEKGTASRLVLYPNGYIDSKYEDNKLKSKLWGLSYEDVKYKFTIKPDCPLPLTMSVPYKSFKLNEAGLYTLQADLTYSIEEEVFNLSFSKGVVVE